MKKFSRVLCVLLAVLALVCMHTVAFAADPDGVDGEMKPYNIWEYNTTNNETMYITTAAGEVLLQADFGEIDAAGVKWEVLSGKEVVSVRKHATYEGVATASALTDGKATVIAYLEDEQQVSAVCEIEVSGQMAQDIMPPTFRFSISKGTSVSVSVNGAESVKWDSSLRTAQYAPGTVFTMTANEDDTDYTFKYWAEELNGSTYVVSTAKTYTFVMPTIDRKIIAVYDATGDRNGYNVAYIADVFVASDAYIKSIAKAAPAAPYRRNMTFKSWKANDNLVVAPGDELSKSDLTGSTSFKAEYELNASEAEITVIGGSGSGTYEYGDPVTVALEAEAQEGKVFLFWSKDGAPVSYEETYKFTAVQDCTICAVFADTGVETDGIAMAMLEPVIEGDAVAFTFERTVPENYTFITSGFVVGTSEFCEIGDGNAMEAVSFRKGAHTQTTKSMAKKSGTYYARGYVTYKDAEGVKTIYTAPKRIVIE